MRSGRGVVLLLCVLCRAIRGLEEDAFNKFLVHPCNDTTALVEMFSKREPTHYTLLINLPHIQHSLPPTLRIRLTFDQLANFTQGYKFLSYFSDSYSLTATVLNSGGNISVKVAPLGGLEYPFPNLVAATVHNHTYCQQGYLQGPWDRFLPVRPIYSQLESSGNPKGDKMKGLGGGCGERVKRHRELIVGGGEGAWPWHAALYRLSHSGGDQQYICGGTLVSSTRIITAGHCVLEGGEPLIPERVLVSLGRASYRVGGSTCQERGVFDIILHPDFQSTTLRNDIAILKLSTKVMFTDYVQPICLWEGEKRRNDLFGKYGYVVGWGATSSSTFSHNLRQLQLPVRSDLECLQNNPAFFGRFLSENTFCGGYANGSSACNGDSGGGFYLEEGGRWHLGGIISLAVAQRNENKCDPNYFTVFTNVAQYNHFILQHIQ